MLIQLFAQAKRAYPEQRMAQIIFNALDCIGKARCSDGSPRDIFYITDAEMEAAFKEFLKR